MAPDAPDPTGFALDVMRGDDGAATVVVAGEVDLANAGELSRAVGDALRAGDVLLDLSAVTFLDSSGVSALNTALRDAAEAGRSLRVRSALQPGVAQILELTGMMTLLEVVEA